MDVVTAYLNGDLNEKVYMKVPDELVTMLNECCQSRQVVSDNHILETAKNWKNELQNKDNKVCLL